MAGKQSYKELEQRIKELEKEVLARRWTEEALQRQVSLGKIVAAISTGFINSTEDIDSEITRALELIGTFSKVDRSYLFLFSEDGRTMDNTHEWCAEGIEPQIDNLKGLSVEVVPWWMERLNRFENIHIPRVADLPPEAKAEKETLEAQDIQSLIVVPVAYQSTLTGFLGFDSVRSEKTWSQESITLLKLAAEIFANALERKRMQDDLIATKMRLQYLLTSTPAVIYTCKPTGDYPATFMSENIEDQLGYKPQEFTEDSEFWAGHIHPEDAPRVFSDLHLLFESGHHTHEYRFRHKDGSYRWMHDELRLICDPEGRPLEIVGYWIDINRRKQAEKELRKSEETLKMQANHLKEVNAALRVLLKQREDDKKELEEKILLNVKTLIMPYIEELKKRRLDNDQMTYIRVLESNMRDIISPFITKLSSKFLNLTATEIKVAGLIRDGKTTKEIGELLHLSNNTIITHRYNLRTKLNLRNIKVNLRSYLQTLQN
ncbi:MAG: PAS domain-containing protein [Thermodesulfobacteriota bacterium]